MTTQPTRELPSRADVLLVCSAGGHLLQLWSLRGAWHNYDRAWVVASHEGSDVAWLLAEEHYTFCHSPTTRNVRNLLKNAVLAWRVIGQLQPRVVVTTGAGIAVPFAWVARIRGARVVYVESLARSERPSLSCRLARPAVDRLYVQWPELAESVRGARYAGSVFGQR
jgi:beta-1,4-N-acetylglucosaminyltransferase